MLKQTSNEEALVPLIQSLVCLKGHDSGRRFAVISLVCYILLIVLAPVLSKLAILMILLFLVTTPVLALAALRRIHDAGFATPLAGIPMVVYWLIFFSLIYIDANSKWTFLILGALVTVAFSALNNNKVRRNHRYDYGYSGPVVLKQNQRPNIVNERIEPTIAAPGHYSQSNSEQLSNTSSEQSDGNSPGQVESSQYASRDAHHWQAQFSEWIVSNQTMAIAAISLIALLIFTAVMMSDEAVKEDDTIAKNIEPIVTEKKRLNKLEMPDQFWIMHDQNDAITIGWEGSLVSGEATGFEYWSAATAIGDKDCISLSFTLGEKIRTLDVTVKNGGDYYASFSPVDSEVLIKSIANKDRFKLCGYEFKLNGTRAILTKNSKYSGYLKP